MNSLIGSPREDKRPYAGLVSEGGQPQVHVEILRYSGQLASPPGQSGIQLNRRRQVRPRCAGSAGLALSARQARPAPQGQHDDPARHGAGHAREQVQEEVDDQAPEGRTDDEALRQRQPIVGLPQRHPRHDVADRGQREQFGSEQQEAGERRPDRPSRGGAVRCECRH